MLEFWNSFKKNKYSYWLCYSAMFIFLTSMIFFRFVLYHKTIIWYQDGLKQHYNAILYYGRYLRQIAGTLIREHRFELPMWDFTIGYGSDIITTFHYYAVGDPLALLVGLVPERFCQYFFCLLYLMRLYLAGLSFSLFSFWHGNKRFSTLVGSFIYVFSAYSLVLGLMHPFFVAPLVWFPLILLGIDKIMKGEKPTLFIVFTAIAAMSNFYFFYMEIALAILYALYRYFQINKGFQLKSFAQTLGKFIICGFNAFLISSVILLPMISVMMTSARFKASDGTGVKILYSLSFYLKFLAGFTNMINAGSWTLMGYTSLGLLAVAFAFIRRKQFKRELIVFTVLTLFAIIPFGGFALNGFAYVVNRWIWGYAMAVAFIAARVISSFQTITDDERKKLAVIVMIYCTVFAAFSVSRSEQSMLSAALLLLCVLVINLVDIRKLDQSRFRFAVIFLLIVGLAANTYYKQSVSYDDGDWLEEFLDLHVADKKLKEENADSLLDDVNSDEFYRIEEVGIDTTQNSSIQRGVYGTQFYHSITNPNISEFIDKMYMNWPKDYDYEGVESRSILEALASVKYLFVGEGAQREVPFNFKSSSVSGDTPVGNVSVFEADTALPLGYTYSEYVSESRFDEMDPVERADAMLNGAVLETSSFKEADLADNSVNALKSIETKGNIEVRDNEFLVKRNAKITLKLDAPDNAETYIIFKNLKYKGMKERDSYEDGEWANMRGYDKAVVNAKDRFSSVGKTSSMLISTEEVSKVVEVYAPGADFYCGRHNFLVNLGYNEKSPDELVITFRKPGRYSFDSFEIVSRPVDGIEDGIKKLAQDVMTETEIGVNSVRGRISLKEDKILALSIPYSQGWTAYVDGHKAELKRCNIMYMAVELTKGDHEIELRYETPALKPGAYMTLAGIIMLAVILIAGKFFNKDKSRGQR